MPDKKYLLDRLTLTKKQVDDWIHAAEEQQAKNFEALYNLQKGLNIYIYIVTNDQKFDQDFLYNWNNLWGWIPRFFDGDTFFIDLLNEIDEYIPD